MTSVVICAYTTKRWDQLQAAVESVARQSDDVEIVIVVDHSDALFDMCVGRWPHRRVVSNQFAQGLSGARNTGVSQTTGDVIAFLDDDATAESGWLDALAAGFTDPSVGGVGGHIVPAWAQNPPPWLPSEFWWVVGCSYTGQPRAAQEIRNPIGANMAFARSVFEKVGGFRDEIGRVGTIPLGCEETELSIRARAAGFSIWYRPDAIVHHFVPAERLHLRYFLRRTYAEGLSKAVVSGLAGRAEGLASERTYVTRTLRRAVRDAGMQVIGGPARVDGLRRMMAVVAGLAAASAGFVRGSLTYKRRSAPLGPAPQIQWDHPVRD